MSRRKARSTAWRAARSIDQPACAAYVSRVLEAMAWEGWNPMVGHPKEMANQQQEDLLAKIAADLSPDDAALWIKNEMTLRPLNPAGHADRLSRAMKSGTVRTGRIRSEVLQAVADFVKENRAWPLRSEISLANVSAKSKDLVFAEIAKAFEIELDGRVRWVDPQ
jgi:hypothetical protein